MTANHATVLRHNLCHCELGCLESFPCIIPQAVLWAPCLQTGGTQKLRQHSRSRWQRPRADGAAFPARSCHGAGSECCRSRAPLQPGGNLRPPLAVNLLLEHRVTDRPMLEARQNRTPCGARPSYVSYESA